MYFLKKSVKCDRLKTVFIKEPKMKSRHTYISLDKNGVVERLMVICSFLLITCNISSGVDKSWEPVEETMYKDILEIIEMHTKANYEKINLWQGKMDILESEDYYGDSATQEAYIDEKSPAAKSKHIRRIVTGTAEFAIDIVNDKLYCNLEPQVKYRAVDLNLDAPVQENIRYSRIRSIVTPQEFITYEPDHNFGYSDSILVSAKISGKAAFLDSPEKAKDRLAGDIRDPRMFFDFGKNEKIWETISTRRKVLSDEGNITIAGRPHLSIAEIDADSHKQYKITTLYFASQHDKNDYTKVELVVDSSVGYNAVKMETIYHGIPRMSVNLTYEKIGDVFVPKTFHRILLNNEGKCIFDSQSTLTKSIINELISEKTFTYENLGLQNGVRFVDNIKRIEYWYENGKLIPASEKIQNTRGR
jgi:hypothetical protein